MKPPKNPKLPYFAYGLFKPGELAYRNISKYIDDEPEPMQIGGVSMFIRDGIPLLSLEPTGIEVDGLILKFREEENLKAYMEISNFISLGDKGQYEWACIKINGVETNCLVGHDPVKGSFPFEESSWSGKNDPLFNECLKAIDTAIEECGSASFNAKDFDWNSFFKLEMAYLLLWSAIERYCTFAFGLSKRPSEKKDYLSYEDSYMDAIEKYVYRVSTIVDNETMKPITLRNNRPTDSIRYYYKVRSHITHRGKAAERDADIVSSSLTELLSIFRDVLEKTLFNQLNSEACSAEAAAVVSKRSTG